MGLRCRVGKGQGHPPQGHAHRDLVPDAMRTDTDWLLIQSPASLSPFCREPINVVHQ